MHVAKVWGTLEHRSNAMDRNGEIKICIQCFEGKMVWF